MSSKRAIRRRSCKGKQRFEDYREAHGAMIALIRNKGTDGRRPLNVYRCRFCGGYHFGHTPRGQLPGPPGQRNRHGGMAVVHDWTAPAPRPKAEKPSSPRQNAFQTVPKAGAGTTGAATASSASDRPVAVRPKTGGAT